MSGGSSGLLTRWASEERPTQLLGLARIALSALILKNSVRMLRDLDREGYFASYFFMPLVPESWVPDEASYRLLVGLKGVAALLALIGILPRASLFTAAAVGLYILTCDRLHYHNNLYATHIIALLLSWSPCGDGYNAWQVVRRLVRSALEAGPSGVLATGTAAGQHEEPSRERVTSANAAAGSVTAAPRAGVARAAPSRSGPYWAVRLTQIQVSIVYLASGIGKLFDADWRGGIPMHLRFARASHRAPELAGQLLRSPLFGEIASKLAIFTELFVALGLWFPRTRALAFWLGILFHLGIQASASVDLFSWLMLSSYVLFVTPELRERAFCYDASRATGRLVATMVRALDWFQRFRRESASVGETHGGALQVVDRSGRTHVGFAAIVALCRALPLLFPLWLPLQLIALASRGRSLAAPAARPEPQP